MDQKLELILRSVSIFLGTFFTTRWFGKQKANSIFFFIAFIAGMFLNYYGPLKF